MLPLLVRIWKCLYDTWLRVSPNIDKTSLCNLITLCVTLITLICFLQDYLAHIIDMSNLPIRPEQVCALFGNIEDIYEFNR